MNMDTKSGGIGLNSPRYKAIPASIIATKGTLNTIYNGVSLGPQRERYKLPEPITSLYSNEDIATSTTFRIFNKFAPTIAALCTGDNSPSAVTKFINQTSINKCHEKINNHVSSIIKFEFSSNIDSDSKHNIDEILDGKMGQGLLDLPRSDERTRQHNSLFRFNLLRCLRLNIWETNDRLTCPLCKQDFDTKGDHLFQCAKIGKRINGKMHNKWRNSWTSMMNTLIPFIHLTDTKIKQEKTGLVSSISNSNVRPFDTHFNLPIISNESYFRSKLRTIGFDIVLCNSDTCPPPSRGGSDAKSKDIVMSLLTVEKNKFQRGKGTKAARTDSQSGITISGDQIIGDLYNDNKQLIPFAISPLGLFGPTINNFLYGTLPPSTTPDKLHNINQSRFPHAARMAIRANSHGTPSNILQRANDIWKAKHPDKLYGTSYKTPDPRTHFTQQFGREVCFTNGSAGLQAITLLKDGPQSKSSPNPGPHGCHDDTTSFLFHRSDTTDSPRDSPMPDTLNVHSPLTC